MEHFLIQHKQAGKKTHTIKLEELLQLRSDAVQQDKTPVYMIEFDEGPIYYLVDGIAFDLIWRHLELD